LEDDPGLLAALGGYRPVEAHASRRSIGCTSRLDVTADAALLVLTIGVLTIGRVR
jgi:hypothetical protein